MVEGGRLDNRFEPVAIYSRQQQTGDTFAAKHAIPKIYTSLDDMLKDGEVEAVYVASPNAIHCRQTIQCLEAGRKVLCEKAFASNYAEAWLMIDSARKHKLLLMEAMIPTLSPAFQVLRDNLHRVGVIRRYFASYCQYSSRYDNLKKGIVANAFKPELSNGALMDIGVYCLYPMIALFGNPKGEIFISGQKLYTGVDGQGTIVAPYDGFDAVAIYSKIADSLLPTEIQGEDGTLIVDRINEPHIIKFKPRGKDVKEEILYSVTDENPYYHEIKHFIDLDEQGLTESPLNSFENTLATMRLLDKRFNIF